MYIEIWERLVKFHDSWAAILGASWNFTLSMYYTSNVLLERRVTIINNIFCVFMEKFQNFFGYFLFRIQFRVSLNVFKESFKKILFRFSPDQPRSLSGLRLLPSGTLRFSLVLRIPITIQSQLLPLLTQKK
jgi:hypothetical protein